MDAQAISAATNRQMIWDVYSRLFSSLDQNQIDEFAACFTADGEIHVQGRGTSRGVSELRDYIPATAAGRPCHHFVNFRVSALNTSSAKACAWFTLVSADTGELYARGHTDDTLVADSDGAWQFVTARFLFDWTSDSYRRLGRIDLASP